MFSAWAPTSFRGRMALLFGFLSLLVGLPTYLYGSAVHREQLLHDRHAALNAQASSAATVIAENMIERRREIELLAQTPLYRHAPLDSPEFQASLERLQRSYPYYSWIGIAAPDGQVLAATSGHLVGQSAAQRPWFKHGQQGVYVGDVHEAVLLAKLLPSQDAQTLRFIDFAAPVLDKEGRVRAVLASHAHWRWAGDTLRLVQPANASQQGMEIFIVNARNEIIYPENAPASLKAPTPAQLSQASKTLFHDWGGSERYLTASAVIREPVPSVPLGWRVILRQPEATIHANVQSLQRVILIGSGVSAVIMLLLVWVGADRVSRPLATLTHIAHRVERGEADVVFDAQFKTVELQRLSSALQSMSSTLLNQKKALADINLDLEAQVAARTADLLRANNELDQLARTDALTGVPNRLKTSERLAEEFARFQRGHEPYAVLMVDVDFFKKVNDTYGHATGDEVLRHVANVLSGAVREIDFVGRTGGEEFMVILPLTKLEDALTVADKLRQAVATPPIEPVGSVSISIGVQEVSEGDATPEEAVARADQQLYRAKQGGRNRVEPARMPQASSEDR